MRLGPLAQRMCLNAAGRSCTTDADCFGAAGSCIPTPRCFLGAPLPFHAGIASVCLVQPLSAPTTATVDRTTGRFSVASSARTIVYLTAYGDIAPPCPRCVAGMCDSGLRSGLSCTVGSATNDETILDCLPLPSQFYLALDGGTAVQSNEPTSLVADGNGKFCADQVHPGAFGDEDARRIEVPGIAAGDLRDHQPHLTTLQSVGCVSSTGNPTADSLADFPGPQVTSTTGTWQLIE